MSEPTDDWDTPECGGEPVEQQLESVSEDDLTAQITYEIAGWIDIDTAQRLARGLQRCFHITARPVASPTEETK
jgi:hypothetical protein